MQIVYFRRMSSDFRIDFSSFKAKENTSESAKTEIRMEKKRRNRGAGV